MPQRATALNTPLGIIWHTTQRPPLGPLRQRQVRSEPHTAASDPASLNGLRAGTGSGRDGSGLPHP